jgi:predicted permease
MAKQERNDNVKKVSLLSLIGSLFAGAFGVQTEKNRARDFTHGKFSHFIIGGIIFAIIFVLAIYGIVQLVVSNATR